MMMIKNCALLLILINAVAVEQLDAQYCEKGPMVLKYEQYKPVECERPKKISAVYSASVELALPNSEELQLNENDFIQCEIESTIENEQKTKLVMFTRGSTTNDAEEVKIQKPGEKNCFSFLVETTGTVRISLHNRLTELQNFVQIEIGSRENMFSRIYLNDDTCESCPNIETPGILSKQGTNEFWITWDADSIGVGKIFENETFMSWKIDKEIETDFMYIGVSTPMTDQVHYSKWYIEDDFCPDILYRPKTHQLVSTKCHKIYDEAAVSAENIPEEKKVLKKLLALTAEFHTENSANINWLTVERIEEYYMHNLDKMYREKFMQLIKNCERRSCNHDILEQVETTLTKVRKTLENKMKEIFFARLCSNSAFFDTSIGKCRCNEHFAGNGMHCAKDSDLDGIPDYAIEECYHYSLSCRKDNCPFNHNPGQEDLNNNGIGDACETEPEDIKTCHHFGATLGRTSTILAHIDVHRHLTNKSIEFLLILKNFGYHPTLDIIKFVWSMSKPTFTLELDSPPYSRTLWKQEKGEEYKTNSTYRFQIVHSLESIRLIINEGSTLDTNVVRIPLLGSTYLFDSISLCFPNSDITWKERFTPIIKHD